MEFDELPNKYILYLVYLFNPENKSVNTTGFATLASVLPRVLNKDQQIVTANKYLLYNPEDLKKKIKAAFPNELARLDKFLTMNGLTIESLYANDEDFLQQQKCPSKGAKNPSLANLNSGRFLCEAFDSYKDITDPDMKCCIKNLRSKFKAAVNANIANRRISLLKELVLSPEEIIEQKAQIAEMPEYAALTEEEKKRVNLFMSPVPEFNEDLEEELKEESDDSDDSDDEPTSGGGCDSHRDVNNPLFHANLNSWFGGKSGKKKKYSENTIFGDSFDRRQLDGMLRRFLMKDDFNLGLTEDDIAHLKRPRNKVKKQRGGGEVEFVKGLSAAEALELRNKNVPVVDITGADEAETGAVKSETSAVKSETPASEAETPASESDKPKVELTEEEAVSQEFKTLTAANEKVHSDRATAIREAALLETAKYVQRQSIPPHSSFAENFYFNIINKIEDILRSYLVLSTEEKIELDKEIRQNGKLSWAWVKTKAHAGADKLLFMLITLLKNQRFMLILIKIIKQIKHDMCHSFNVWIGNSRFKVGTSKADMWREAERLITVRNQNYYNDEEWDIAFADAKIQSEKDNDMLTSENLDWLTNETIQWGTIFFKDNKDVNQGMAVFSCVLEPMPIFGKSGNLLCSAAVRARSEFMKEIVDFRILKYMSLDIIEIINPISCFKTAVIDNPDDDNIRILAKGLNTGLNQKGTRTDFDHTIEGKTIARESEKRAINEKAKNMRGPFGRGTPVSENLRTAGPAPKGYGGPKYVSTDPDEISKEAEERVLDEEAAQTAYDAQQANKDTVLGRLQNKLTTQLTKPITASDRYNAEQTVRLANEGMISVTNPDGTPTVQRFTGPLSEAQSKSIQNAARDSAIQDRSEDKEDRKSKILQKLSAAAHARDAVLTASTAQLSDTDLNNTPIQTQPYQNDQARAQAHAQAKAQAQAQAQASAEQAKAEDKAYQDEKKAIEATKRATALKNAALAATNAVIIAQAEATAAADRERSLFLQQQARGTATGIKDASKEEKDTATKNAEVAAQTLQTAQAIEEQAKEQSDNAKRAVRQAKRDAADAADAAAGWKKKGVKVTSSRGGARSLARKIAKRTMAAKRIMARKTIKRK